MASNIVTSVYFIIAVSLLILVYIKVRHSHSKYRYIEFILKVNWIQCNRLKGYLHHTRYCMSSAILGVCKKSILVLDSGTG